MINRCFKPVSVLRIQPDGKLSEETLLPHEIDDYLGLLPIQHMEIAAGLHLFFSWHSRFPNSEVSRITVLYTAIGRIRACIYGNVLIARCNQSAYASVRDGDISIVRMFVKSYESRSKPAYECAINECRAPVLHFIV